MEVMCPFIQQEAGVSDSFQVQGRKNTFLIACKHEILLSESESE